MNMDQEKQLMKKILSETKVIAVVGLSDKPYRTSYQIALAMQNAGYKIIPVNPNVDNVLGKRLMHLSLILKKIFNLRIFLDDQNI